MKLKLIVLALALPIGVAASIYLEEFAPKNRLTDLIEVNIANLAAVPSIVYGILGLAVFIAGSVGCGLAGDIETLIAARALLGVSGAAIMPSTLALIRNIFTDPKERTRAIAIWSAAFGGGSAIGPLVGGLLLEHFWWGSVFLVNVPVMLVMLVAGIVLECSSRSTPDSPRASCWPSSAAAAKVLGMVATRSR